MFLACGSARFGAPATWDKARRAVAEALAPDLGDLAGAIVQVDGAGLSRDNRVTARAMLRLLAAFRPHRDLLPRVGQTLAKTGTLTGVSNLAGYLADGSPFVILVDRSAGRAALLDRLDRQVRAGAAPAADRDS